jgi:cytoskeleton protein RodZ
LLLSSYPRFDLTPGSLASYDGHLDRPQRTNLGDELWPMGSFGERLRREREMRGVTINEIAESTKISRRHLEALENEDFDSLPGGIFNKGFVRAYARFLGIDEDQAVADYTASSNETPEPEDKFPLEIHDLPDPKLNPKRSTLPLILALLALLAVLAIFWTKSRSHPTENLDSNAATGSSPTPEVAPAPASPSPHPSRETPAARPQPPTSVAASPTVSTRVTPEAVESPKRTPSAERTFSVTVAAKEDAWISITADGRLVVSRILSAGEQQSARAGSRIVLITGNAGGVDVSFNGKTLGAIGNESQVRTLTFTSAGLVQ